MRAAVGAKPVAELREVTFPYPRQYLVYRLIKRSVAVSIPNCRLPPFGFGISTPRTACGRYVPAASSELMRGHSSDRWPDNSSTPILSTPAAPLFAFTRLSAAARFSRDRITLIRLSYFSISTKSLLPSALQGNCTSICRSASAPVQTLFVSGGSMFSPSGLPSHARLQATRLVIGTWFGPLLWPLLTSAPGASLQHSRALPSQQKLQDASRFIRLNVPRTFTLRDRSFIQVRTHPFGQSRLHLLHRDCCLRVLARCIALPSLHSLLFDFCSSVPTFAVPAYFRPAVTCGAPRMYRGRHCGLLTGFGNSPVEDFHLLFFRLPFKYGMYICLGIPMCPFWVHTMHGRLCCPKANA